MSKKSCKYNNPFSRISSLDYWTGIGSVMDISGESLKIKEISDEMAIYGDWQKIGQDFNNALTDVRKKLDNKTSSEYCY